MANRFSNSLTNSEGELPEFSVDVFLDNLFGTDAKSVKDRVVDLSQRESGPIYKDFDLDDCFVGRGTILNIPGFRNNRGNDGNIWLFGHYGGVLQEDDHNIITDTTRELINNMSDEQRSGAIANFIKTEYLGKDSLGLARNTSELFWDPSCTYGISTAGIMEIQWGKIHALLGEDYMIETDSHNISIDKDDIKIVPKGIDKIKANLLCLLDKETLPEEYFMNEDRPEGFHKYGQVLANTLEIPITINSIYINRFNEARKKWSVRHSPNI